MKRKLAATLFTVISLLLPSGTVYAAEVYQPSSTVIKSIEGSSYTDTSIKISQQGWTTSDTAIIASSEDFPDALGGTELGIDKDCPIFFATKNSIEDTVLAELKRLGVKNVYILGGTGVIGDNAEKTLQDLGYNVERLAGEDRYSTAVAIGQEIVNNGNVSTVFLSNAYGFADALSCSTFTKQQNAVVLLTDKDSIPPATMEAIKKWNIASVIAFGGTGVISDNVLNQLRAENINASRLSGQDRYDTSETVIRSFGSDQDKLTLITGKDYHDALVAAPYAAKLKQPVMLMDDGADGVAKQFVLNKELLVIGKSFLTPPADEITENSLTYTWNEVRDKVVHAGIGKNLSDIYSTTDYTVYPPKDNVLNYLGLDYNSDKHVNGSFFTVFSMNSLKNAKHSNMDFTLLYAGNNSKDPEVASNVRFALDTIAEAIFPGKGAEFNKASDNVQKRYVTRGGLQTDIPNVLFFGGRRVFMTYHSMGFVTYDFSAIGDNSDIWQEMKDMGEYSDIGLTRDELKQYMPELKDY